MSFIARRALLAIALLAAIAAGGALQPARGVEEKRAAKAQQTDGQEYCDKVARPAAAAKLAAQEAKLREVEAQVRRRAEELEEKRRELQAVVEKHEAMLKKADETIVMVYTKMKSDAAAAQFAVLDDDVAVALLARLTPKISSSILTEMTPARGAGLIKKLAVYSSTKPSGKTP